MRQKRIVFAHGWDVFQQAVRAACGELKARNPKSGDRRDPIVLATAGIFEILRAEIRALMEVDGLEVTAESVETNMCRLLILAGEVVVEHVHQAGTA